MKNILINYGLRFLFSSNANEDILTNVTFRIYFPSPPGEKRGGGKLGVWQGSRRVALGLAIFPYPTIPKEFLSFLLNSSHPCPFQVFYFPPLNFILFFPSLAVFLGITS